MNIDLILAPVAEVAEDALILLDQEGSRRPDLSAAAAVAYDSGEITGKLLDFTLLHGVHGFKSRRILVAGAGKHEKFDVAALRKLAGAAVRFLKAKGIKRAAIALDDGFDGPEHVAAVAEAAITAAWEPDQLKTDKSDKKTFDAFSLVVSQPGKLLDEALERGRIVGEAANLSRDIAVEPPNVLTPMVLAERARAMAEGTGLTVDVLDRGRMQQLGMGSLLGVAEGSAAPPAMIVIQYKPAHAASSAHLALIGKGVTFDTGGISIKPSEGMEKMKYDMAAGAAVIGAMQAIARLKPGIAVTGIVPAVENMPGGKAMRPGDILTSLSGKTIEVLNTDAEGRLILADAITYAKQIGCTHLVDAATLTGAIAVALGYAASGVFTNDDGLLERWMHAAKSAGNVMWQMPLYDEYREQLKTVYADIQNIGGRWGGACTAAMFLKEFVGETPWVHVDVAGTAWLDEAKPYLAKGPTAVPLGAFVNIALNWK